MVKTRANVKNDAVAHAHTRASKANAGVKPSSPAKKSKTRKRELVAPARESPLYMYHS